MYIYFSYVFRLLILLPPEAFSVVSGYFSKVPPSVIYVQTGKTARLEWEIERNLYSQRDTQFGTYSPTWYYKSASVAQTQIAYDWKRSNPPWKWTIARSCPARYLNPTRVNKQSTANLIISNITLEDDGTYVCTLALRNPDRFIEASTRLIVTVSPQFNLQPPLTKNMIEGQELSVLCSAIGPPTPNTTWVQINGHVVISTGTGSVTLRIPNIRRDQNGTYECQARNNPNEDPVTARTVIAVYYPPHSTITPPSLTVVQSDEMVLSCTADGYPPPSISWTKADGVIKAGNTVAGGTLRIPDAIKTDAGKYICTAKNTYENNDHTDSATVTVLVKYQPSITFDKLKNQTLNQSESLSIKCDADGYPPPTIKWKTPTGSVHNGNVYNIPSVSRSHAGTYTCTASNGIGKEAMGSIQVNVQYPPDIDASRSSLLLKSWNGNIILLRCFVTGLPAPRISWYKPTNQQILTGVNIVPGGSEVTVLTTADQGDYGQYKCRATNTLGSDEHVINVTQLSSPGPVSLTLTDVKASSINVTWYKPADDVTGYLVEVSTKPPVITVNTHTVITGLKANTLYAVKVYAKNIVGYGVESSKIIRTQKIGKPSAPELVIALLERSPEFKLSVVLRWEEPDDNGGNISRYTIYVKEVEKKAEWTKYDNVIDSKQLEYKITKNIVYGKTYMFMVTAWNKYGESVKDEGGAKTVNTTADKATATNAINYCIEKGSKTCSTVLGVVIAILVLSIGFNLLQFVYLKRRVQLSSRKQSPTQKRKPRSKKAAAEETYENDLQLEDNPASLDTASRAQQPVQSGSEYQTIHKLNPNKAGSSIDASNYQGLNLMPNMSNQGTCGPVYESLGTRLVEPRLKDNDNMQHPYEPLNIRNQTSVYQSLQTKSSESAI